MKKTDVSAPVPRMTFSKLGGGELHIGGESDQWTLFIVYRGKHCGRCKKYLSGLEAMQDQWRKAGFEILAVSADPEERVAEDVKEFGWSFDIGYDLSEDQMRELGLYISDPLSTGETDRRFAEPGVFCIRPEGTFQIAAISNGPSARPDLAELLDGMIFTIDNGKPARGTVN